MAEWLIKYWKEIVSTLALIVSSFSFALSVKTRKDGNILKLVPKFSTHIGRAEGASFWDSFNNVSGSKGYKISLELFIKNPSPYTLEITEISSDNYFLVYSFSDFDPQPGYMSLKPARNRTGRSYEIKPESERRLSFDVFCETDAAIDSIKFPNIHLILHIYSHSENPKTNVYSIIRPIIPEIIAPKRI
jgi:hypothetical protein